MDPNQLASQKSAEQALYLGFDISNDPIYLGSAWLGLEANCCNLTLFKNSD